MAGELLWDAREDWLEATAMGAFARAAGRTGSYEELHRWSVTDLDGFWRLVWEHAGLGPLHGPALARDTIPGAVWFPEERVNYAGRMLDGLREDGPVVLARSQTRAPVELTAAELRDQVARCAAGLRALGVGRGDRVVAYLPNVPEALVAMLATAALGAIWSSCPPEFGTKGVIDRFQQIAPKVLLACDGYVYGAKRVERADAVAQIVAALPTLEHTVAVPYLHEGDGWRRLLSGTEPLAPEPVPFDHPLYILFSSGTTGLPKPIVHGHGAMLVEHHKQLSLHLDLDTTDRFFWFSTTGWMMWNLLVSGLLTGAAIVLFDGDPGHPGPDALWRLAQDADISYFGVGAPLLTASMRAGLRPACDLDLSCLSAVGSTGSPLSEDGFRWVCREVQRPVHSLSGGTDVCSGFLGAAPAVPIWAGELSCRMLGCDVRAFGPDGGELPPGELGELVITRPMPSFPVGFWGDADGSRYRAAYFEDFPGVWRHGDWVTFTERGSCVITGRSDATLNRGGVRMGTAELYGVVERLPEVADSLVVHLPGGEVGELVLYVVTDDELDDALLGRIRTALRTELSPRHVPDRIERVPGVPRTLSGKKCEVPVKRILLGEDPERVINPASLQNPEALAAFGPTVAP